MPPRIKEDQKTNMLWRLGTGRHRMLKQTADLLGTSMTAIANDMMDTHFRDWAKRRGVEVLQGGDVYLDR